MISSKILVQSATAGLMAGAILTIPVFLFPSSDQMGFESHRCSYAERVARERAGVRRQMMRRYERYHHYQPNQHVLRAAPPVDGMRRIEGRTLEQRNQAAREALQQIGQAYANSEAQQKAAGTAHTVYLHTRGTQVATQVSHKAAGVHQRALQRCLRADKTDRAACQRLRQALKHRAPLIQSGR